MYFTEGKQRSVHELIRKLYSRPFNEFLVLEISDQVCRCVDADYFSLYITALERRSLPLVISNNTKDFIQTYLSVAGEDFLMDDIVASHRECALHSLRDSVIAQPRYQNFIHAVQSARPISDIVYLPITLEGALIGHWGLARAGLGSPDFSENELDIYRFIGGFLNDAFFRSMLPPPVEDDIAYLDYRGHTLVAGPRIKDAFAALFHGAQILEPGQGHSKLKEKFLAAYNRFIHGPFTIGMDRLTLISGTQKYAFQFTEIKPGGLPIHHDGLPFASVTLCAETKAQSATRVLDLPSLSIAYGLTPREEEVILGIFMGQSNKVIAGRLGIDEGTVKKHTHNIYEKTGFKSRTSLVLGFSNLP